MDSLMKEYVIKVEEPLHNSLNKFYEFVTKENVEKYAKGIIGGNELTIYRARMYTECIEELHLALKDAALVYLDNNGFGNEDYKKYVDEVVRFSSLRKLSFENYIPIKDIIPYTNLSL